MDDSTIPDVAEVRDATPSSAEWLATVKDELEQLEQEVAAVRLPAAETPIVRNTVEGLSVALRGVHRQTADLEKLLAELAEQKE